MRLIKGKVSYIVVLNDKVCSYFYDIDETTLGISFPRIGKTFLLKLYLALPNPVLNVLERIFVPIKMMMDKPVIDNVSGCFITSRSINVASITIRELITRFNNVNIVVFRKSNIRVIDYYRFVVLDLTIHLNIKPKLIMYG